MDVAASSSQPWIPRHILTWPRIAIAVLSGEPKIKLPLVGSPSAKSMSRSDNRSASIISPAWHFA